MGYDMSRLLGLKGMLERLSLVCPCYNPLALRSEWCLHLSVVLFICREHDSVPPQRSLALDSIVQSRRECHWGREC